MSKIITVATGKGGGGKSTTAWHIGVGLHLKRKNVLIVDLDQQLHLTNWISQTLPEQRRENGYLSTSELIYQEVSGMDVYGGFDKFIQRSSNDDLDFIQASKMLAGALSTLASDSNSITVLNRIFRNKYFQKYDYIILDCPPAFDLLVSNALYCCDSLLVPVQAEYPSYDGIMDILEKLKVAKKAANPLPYIEGFLVSMIRRIESEPFEIFDLVKQSYGDLTFAEGIPYLSDIKKCVSTGKSVVYKPDNDTGKAFMAAVDRIIKNDERRANNGERHPGVSEE